MLEFVVFICGAVVMILELAGSRILAPHLGSSLIVWTSLIGIILGSLSIGYWWGGLKADKNPNCKSLSLIILLAAFFVAAIGICQSFIFDFLEQYTISIRYASAIATAILFAPPSVLLGMVSPYSVKLKLISLENSGNTVGRLYAISTIGSILGTFLGGFYLIAFFGSSRILYILCIVLAFTSLVAFRGEKGLKLAALALFIGLTVAAGSYERFRASKGFHDIDTDYSRIVVYEAEDFLSGKIRVMTTHPRAMQSAINLEDTDRLVLPYTRFFNLASCFKQNIASFLILGGGGYSFPKYVLKSYPGATVDVVEIDPGVTELARQFFFLQDSPRLGITHEDARSALRKMDKKYDAILVDVFNSHYSIPFHLTTRETAMQISDRLADDGVVVVNILSAIEGSKGRFLRAEYATYRSVFKHVRLFPVSRPEDGSVWQNVMLVAMKSGEAFDIGCQSSHGELMSHLWNRPVSEDMPVLTDDFAPVDSYIAFQ